MCEGVLRCGRCLSVVSSCVALFRGQGRCGVSLQRRLSLSASQTSAVTSPSVHQPQVTYRTLQGDTQAESRACRSFPSVVVSSKVAPSCVVSFRRRVSLWRDSGSATWRDLRSKLPSTHKGTESPTRLRRTCCYSQPQGKR